MQLHADFADPLGGDTLWSGSFNEAPFVWVDNSAPPNWMPTVPPTANDASELLSPILDFPLELGHLPTSDYTEPLSSTFPFDWKYLTTSGSNELPLPVESNMLPSLPDSIPSPSNAPVAPKLKSIPRNPTRRRSNSLGSRHSQSILRNRWQGRRRSKSVEAPALKGILRNGPITRQIASNVGRMPRSVHFAETNSVWSSFDTEASTSRESSISISSTSFASASSRSNTGTARHFSASRSSFAFASTSHYFDSPSAASSASCSPSFDDYDADLESLNLSFTPRLDDFFSPTQSPTTSNMTPPLTSLLQYYIDAEGTGSDFTNSPIHHSAAAHRQEAIPLPPSNPTDNMVAQIINSISRSTSELTGAVLCEEPQSFLPEEPVTSTGPTSVASTLHRSATAFVSSSTAHTAGIEATVSDTSGDASTNAALSIFPNANQFDMRDPTFHAAQRDVQIVNVYNITINQLEATSTSTNTAGEG